MKILCVSDQIDPLVYSSNIKERFADVDFILCAGDLPMDYLDFISSSLNKPLYFVLGNHHARDQGETGGVHIKTKVVLENGLLIAGLGGSMRYNRGENQFTEIDMYFEIFRLLLRLFFNRLFHGRYVDILLTHAPPRGIHDREDKCHRGFRAFLWFMSVFRPKYLIHGHIHLYDLSDVRSTQWKDTLVINAYSHYIIDTDE
ncbi:MAG: metallophosphoesterase [Treponema sp.]|jgi:Icc-related predicted phosphoesterase|nr:metallophosphoesterase [Treponema sp.]